MCAALNPAEAQIFCTESPPSLASSISTAILPASPAPPAAPRVPAGIGLWGVVCKVGRPLQHAALRVLGALFQAPAS